MTQQTLFPMPVIGKSYPDKLCYADMDFFALAGWHRHYREKNNQNEMRVIEVYVSQLPDWQKRYIGKLNYYQPLK